ncbi:MAG: hypothetical protein HC929_24565 [Leptolyngbyaceae cyanobacterium SM2_5_2]|nr:hypothetical protein [Leptolyngbyaceae cyanobacterium SM2_5_2]
MVTGGTEGDVNLAVPDFQPLERFLAGRPLLPSLSLTLVAESDAPCRFQLSQANLSYRLTYQGFSPGSPAPAKQVLRFQSADLRPQTLVLTMPAQVRAASLSMSLSLSSTPQSADLRPATRLTLPTQRQGVEVLPQQWAGQQFTPPAATRLSGITLGLLLLPSATTLTVELQADNGGQPAGLIAQTTLTTQGTAHPQWVTAIFPQPQVLYTQPYWLLISPSQPAIWLTQPGDNAVFLLERPVQATWGTRQRYPQPRDWFNSWPLPLRPRLPHPPPGLTPPFPSRLARLPYQRSGMQNAIN